MPYDFGPATKVAVNAGDSITIEYLSGLTTAFGGDPTVDANGYAGDIFGSGADCGGIQCSGIGSSGQPFPSAFIDPSNTGPKIALNELIGDFVDGSGVVLSACGWRRPITFNSILTSRHASIWILSGSGPKASISGINSCKEVAIPKKNIVLFGMPAGWITAK